MNIIVLQREEKGEGEASEVTSNLDGPRRNWRPSTPVVVLMVLFYVMLFLVSYLRLPEWISIVLGIAAVVISLYLLNLYLEYRRQRVKESVGLG
ncbi:MAG: hypothetical protein M1556_01140 [Candidatus Thermoplasmatota archaeon]|nr:hypothetical protein [Candidatus Thermoplasmatota archaeon]MCL6002239.1 hypothetical protein [Candidatus Thermoplasmatota archaeon]